MAQTAFDFGDEPVDDPGELTFSVGELADAIHEQLRTGFRDGVWVRGEVTGLKRGGPHIYFSLVDRDRGSEAKIEVKLFAPAIARLTPKLRSNRLDVRDGMKVRIHGHLDFYKPRGTLGLKMDDIDPRYTLGEIARSRDEILRRLIESGLVAMNAQRPLSPVPLRVGVAASVESAGFIDFHTELGRSGFAFDLVVADTRVQGDGADRKIAGAIGTLARGARKGVLDAIVVVRGGGAKNELAVFDSERIAHTIAMVPCPVLTGIGHEIDRTIADEVAHTALKTPTACAGALVERVARYVQDSDAAFDAIIRRAFSVNDTAERRLNDTARRIAGRTSSAIHRADERVAMRLIRLAESAPLALSRATERLDAAASRVVDRSDLVIERASQQIDVRTLRVASVDPAVQLARGWTITRTADGSIVRSTADVPQGSTISTDFVDGRVTSVVESVHPSPDSESDTST